MRLSYYGLNWCHHSSIVVCEVTGRPTAAHQPHDRPTGAQYRVLVKESSHFVIVQMRYAGVAAKVKYQFKKFQSTQLSWPFINAIVGFESGH